MRKIMDLWSRITGGGAPEMEAPRALLERDPDLDAMHQQQHDLIHKSGYARARIRDSWNERLRDSWRPIIHDAR